MARVTITVEGQPQEVRRTLRKLLGPMGRGGQMGQHRHGCGQGGPGRRGEMMRGEGQAWRGRSPWTTEELTQLWNEITVGARTVLTEVAKKPTGYPNTELQTVLGMAGNAIGGTLSSVGVVSRRFGPKPPVYKFRWDEYRMPPHVAELITLLSQGQSPSAPSA